MSRFAAMPPQAPNAPWSLGPNPTPILTHQGGAGYAPSDAHVELFNAAVSGLLADQFYESGDARIKRLMALVPKCDPDWLANFITWLRDDAHMRSASVVLAGEYARAKFPNARSVVASALKRPDEPGEMIAYWHAMYGRKLPAAVKRGVADACVRLYNEVGALRYDGSSKAFRLGDVIELVHPKPTAEWQSSLFKFLLDRRRHTPTAHPGVLPKVSKTLMVENIPQENRTPGRLRELLADRDVVFSWERAAGWVNGGMSAEVWEALIPTMGYLALLRNLNNFDRARIGSVAAAEVARRLTDADEVAKSKVLPFRFLTAYKALEADTYKVALSIAADLSVQNMPRLAGRTIILVDCSGSMSNSVGTGKSRQPLTLSELAGFMAEAVAGNCEEAVIYTYNYAITSGAAVKSHVNLLRRVADPKYRPNGGTHTWDCVSEALRLSKGADRVIVFTDEQSGDADRGEATTVITWNLAGYQPHHAAHGKRNRLHVAGYSDAVLQTLPSVIALGSTGRWPWESAS